MQAPYWHALGLLLAMLEEEFRHVTPGVSPFLIQAGYHLARHSPEIGPELGQQLLRGVGV